MSGYGIEVTYPELTAALGRLSDVLTDMTPAFDEIGQAMVFQTLKRFEDQQDPDGRPWEPLAAETILRRLGGAQKAYKKDGSYRKGKAEEAANLKILDAKGFLKRSITQNPSADQVEVGSDIVYSRIHQLGGQAGRGNKVTIPARPYLGVNQEDGAEIIAILQRHLAAALETADA